VSVPPAGRRPPPPPAGLRPAVPATTADRLVLRAVWSLGAATPATLAAALAAPSPDPPSPDGPGPAAPSLAALERRLRRLRAGGLLASRALFTGPAGHRQLWSCRPAAGRLDPALAGGWRPALGAVEHTVAVGRALVAALGPGFAPPLRTGWWQGEAELRAAIPSATGCPYPDLVVGWTAPAGVRGRLLVEVDRGTETRTTWRRKLERYLAVPPAGADWCIAALAPGPLRARHLAETGFELRLPMVAAPLAAWLAGGDPWVLCTRSGSRRRLTDALAARLP
jgi:hypothetical protein